MSGEKIAFSDRFLSKCFGVSLASEESSSHLKDPIVVEILPEETLTAKTYPDHRGSPSFGSQNESSGIERPFKKVQGSLL